MIAEKSSDVKVKRVSRLASNRSFARLIRSGIPPESPPSLRQSAPRCLPPLSNAHSQVISQQLRSTRSLATGAARASRRFLGGSPSPC